MKRWASWSTAVALATFLFSFDRTALAVTRTWGGTLSGLWSEPGNWSGAAVPQPGDDLVFPVGAPNRAMTNDLATGASFTTFSFTGDGYSLDGNAIELRKLVFASVTTGATLSLPIRLAGTASFSNEGAGVKLSGALDLSVHTLTVSGDGKLDITGPISGSGALTRAGGTGILVLSGDNTYSGVTEISSGVLRVRSSSAFGAPSSGTPVDASGPIPSK